MTLYSYHGRMLAPIGSYRYLAAHTRDDGPPIYGHAPIYGTRVRLLPATRRVAHQVLTPAFGELVWINVPHTNATLDSVE